MAKVFTIPSPPQIGRKRRERTSDPRYVDGQRLLVEAMRYLAQADPVNNRGAIELKLAEGQIGGVETWRLLRDGVDPG